MTRPALSVLKRPADPVAPDGLDPDLPDEHEAERVSGGRFLFWAALAEAVVFGLSTLFDGFYNFEIWGVVSLVLLVVLAMVIVVGPVSLSRPAALTVGGIALLLVWSALSMTWAESTDRAWTEVNRLGLYLAILLVALTGIRTRRQARVVFATLAVAAAGVALYTLIRLVAPDGEEMFITFRLAEPLGYTNGEAGFLLMGFWLFVAIAEHQGSLLRRGVAMGFAVVSLELVVLTQARAVVPALVVSAVVLLAAVPGRFTRAWALAFAGAGTAIALPWLLDPYAEHVLSGVRGTPLPETVRTAGLIAIAAAALAGVAWAMAVKHAPRFDTQGNRKRGVIVLAAVPAVVVALGVASMNDPVQTVRSQWKSFFSLGSPAPDSERFTSLSGTRSDLWRVAKDQFESSPLKGVGAGNFTKTYYRERKTDEYARQPHSLVMQTLGELGIVGALALAIALSGVLMALLSRNFAGIARTDRRILVGAGGAFAVWVSHTSIDWLHVLPGVTGFALVCAALLLVERPSPEGRRDWFDRAGASRKLVLVGAIVVIAAMVVSTGRQYAGERYRERAASHVADDPLAALDDVDTALDLNPGAVQAYYVQAAALARLDEYEQARAALGQAARREPNNPGPWTLLGDIAVRRGDLEQAKLDYQEALDRDPRSVELQRLVADPSSAIGS